MQSGFDKELFLSLVAKRLSGNADPVEIKDLESMLQQFPEANSEFEKLIATWNLVGEGFEPEEHESASYNDRMAWQKVSQKLNRPKVVALDTKTRQLNIVWLSVAASILVMLSVGYLVFWNKENAFTTVSGQEVSQINYYDGSTIRLNSDAELSFFSDSTSEIRQFKQSKGAAYYAVAKNQEKPFVVSCNLAEITVLGTQFLVDIYEDSLALSVVEGRVRLKPTFSRETQVVSAGEKWVVTRSGSSMGRIYFPNALAWANKQLKFSNTPLDEVVKDIEQLYTVVIELEPQLKTCKLSGSFSKKSLEEVLDAIAETLELEVIKTDNSYKISGKGC